MAYIAGLIISGLFFLILHFFTELTKMQKIAVSVTVLGVIVSAIFYNTHQNAQREKMLAVVLKYKQNRTIHCNNTEVNSTTHTLSIGTYTFIGKKGTPNYAQMISVSDCN